MNNNATGVSYPIRTLMALLLAFAALASAWTLTSAPKARAQSPACTNAPFHAQTESGAGVAFVDVGAGNTATFVCINSAEFSGGQSPQITSNGAQADGCFVVEGLGTSVVAVYWELPDVRPDCSPITSIDVGSAAAATPTATSTPTATPTATATGTPSPTATTPAATRTTTPAPTTPAATQAPRPPSTGTGTDASSSLDWLWVMAVGGILLAGGAGMAILRYRA